MCPYASSASVAMSIYVEGLVRVALHQMANDEALCNHLQIVFSDYE